MLTSELRANARRALQEKWGKGALLTLCYLLVMIAVEFVLSLIPIVGPIIDIIIMVPISYGITASFMKLKRGENVKFTGFLEEGFSKFGKAWGILGHTLLKMIVPIILIIAALFLMIISSVGIVISGNALENASSLAIFEGLGMLANVVYIVAIIYYITKALLYLLTEYILYDNPDMSSKEIVEESERLMKGNRWRYIWLDLSFIGWVILTGFTFGIGLLWLIPYIKVAIICFYEVLSGKFSNEEVEVIEENNNPISE